MTTDRYDLLRQYKITPQQFETFKSFIKNDTEMRQISYVMDLSVHTVRVHLGEIKRKLGVNTISGAIIKAHRLRLIDLDKIDYDDQTKFEKSSE